MYTMFVTRETKQNEATLLHIQYLEVVQETKPEMVLLHKVSYTTLPG